MTTNERKRNSPQSLVECGCENSLCEKCRANGCDGRATVPCMYVGGICAECAAFMPDEYLPRGREPIALEREVDREAKEVIRDLAIGRCVHGALIGFCTYGRPCEELCRRLQAAVEKFGPEDVEPCGDCGEPVRYDKRAESWRHVEPAPEGCFMVHGNGATLDANQNVAPGWNDAKTPLESRASHPSLQEKSTQELSARRAKIVAQIAQDEDYLPDDLAGEKKRLLERERESLAAVELALEWRGEVIS